MAGGSRIVTTITSVQNPRVKDVVRLRDRRHREKQGRILIDGIREISRALDANLALQELFVCESLCPAECRDIFRSRLHGTATEILDVTEPVFEKLAFGGRIEGVLAVAGMPHPQLGDLRLPASPLVAVLEGVEKPGNIGAVVRSADGAGMDALIVADPSTDLYNPNAIRASLGAIFKMPMAEAASEPVLEWLVKNDFQVVAARVDGSVPYTDIDFRRPTALVLGSEATGLSSVWSGPRITAARLPMLGVGDSLNVSTAAAVLFYEARRQRG